MVLGTYVTEQQIVAMSLLERFKVKHGKGMTVTELATALGGIRRSGVAEMLNRMRAKNFVTRKLDTSAPRTRASNGGNAGQVEAYRWTVTAEGRKWL